MRVALLTPRYEIDGGVSVHVRRSANVLRRAGHEVLIAAGDEVPAAEGFSLAGLGAGPLEGRSRTRLMRELTARMIEVVHFHNVDDPSLVGTANAVSATVLSAHGWSGCPSGARFFGDGRECPRARGPLCVPYMLLLNCKHRRDPRPTLRYYRDAKLRLEALQAADVAVAHSQAVEEHLRVNGVAHTRVVPLPVDAPESWAAISHGNPRVAYAGRLTAVKGVSVLLAGAPHFDAKLDICGDGPARSTLERMTDRLGLRQRVTFHGWCARDQLNDVYDHAYLVVVPSIYPEPFGMAGPEAMARGRAVIASSTGGTSDWLQHGRTGIAVPPGDPKALGRAIAALVSDPSRLQQMGVAGRASVLERFSEAAHLAAVMLVYREATERAAARRRRDPQPLW